MKRQRFVALLLAQILLAGICFAQQALVINDPAGSIEPLIMNTSEVALIKREVLPKARKHWSGNDACEEDFKITGRVRGAFSAPKSNQELVFYQFCQTGNGLANNGLVLIENGRIVGNYISEDGGWALGLKVLRDINQNGLDEFMLYYSGGIHQGEGGTGVDIMEFSPSNVKGLGWFQAEGFTEEDSWSYKVSVKPGKAPLFYHEKYVSKNKKLQKTGKPAPIKLEQVSGAFTALK
jgi:hypothetical protein